MNTKNRYFKLRAILSLVALGIFTTSCFWLFQNLTKQNTNSQAILNLPNYHFDENTNPDLLKGKEKYAYYQYLSEKYAGYTKKDLKKIPKKDRPDLAMIQDYLRTANPNTGEIPHDARIRANELTDLRVNALRNQRAINNVNWTERGPNNVGGRTRALMYDPNDVTGKKVWAGGVGGGLWYTNDISVTSPTWVSVDGFWENIAISAIAYDPSNTQIMYVGTGEGWFGGGMQRGAGMWKTTNGGTTWARIANTSPTVTDDFEYIQKIVVTATGTVLATCRTDGPISTDENSGGIFRSTDNGTNWTKVTLPEQSTRGADLEVTSNGAIYGTTAISGGVVGSIYKSTDDGLTWTEVTPAGIPTVTRRIELSSAPSNGNIIYAIGNDSGTSNISFFKKSIDGGTTWTDVTVPKYLNQNCTVSTNDFTRGQSWYDLILQVNPTDPNHVVVGGIDVHRTTDGGTTWSGISYWTGGCGEYVHADIHAFAYKPNSSDEMLVGSDGGISRSPNIRATTPNFSDKNSGYNVTQFYAAAMHPDNLSAYFLAGAQDNGTQQFTILGTNPTSEATGGDGAFCFIDQDNPNIQITSYVYNNYRISTNGGASFTAWATNNNGSFINPTDYDDAMNLLYSRLSTGGNIARWTVPAGVRTSITVAAATGTVTHLKVSPYSPAATTTLYAGTNTGRVVRIPNAQTGTAPVGTVISNATMEAQGSVSSVEFGSSENQIVVTYSNYGVQSVWYTNDGGTNWVSKDNGHGLPDMPVRWAMFNPNNTNEVLIATETGVWSTDNITAGAAADFWELTSIGLANVRCDMFQIRNSDKLVAVATHGRGLFTTNAFSPAAALFGIDKKFVYSGANVLFTDYSARATSWSWDFGADASIPTATTAGPHTVSYSTGGIKTITLTINGGGSPELTMSKTVTVLPNRPVPYTLADGGNFEVNTTDFAGENVSNSTGWERGNSAIAGKNGVVSGANAWVTGLTVAQYGSNSNANLYAPNFNFSAAGTYTLSFQTKHSFETGWDGMIVEYSTDKGTSWSKLGNATTGTIWYNSTTAGNGTGFGSGGSTFMSGTLANYTLKSLDVSSLVGNPNVAFRIVFKSDTNTEQAGAAVDDFSINFVPTPITVTLGTITPTTYCAGSTISIPFTTTGAFTAGNTFTAQLSDATGNFTTPSATQTGTSPISLTIPATATAATAYKVRVIASNPSTTSNESSALTINALPTDITVVATPASIANGSSSNIQVPTSQTGVTYQLQDVTNGNANIGTVVTGTGATIDLPTGNLTTTTSFRVVATNTTTCSRTLNTVVVTIAAPGGGGGGSSTPVLTTPANFRAVGISTSQINLSWTAVSGATGYLLYTGRTLVTTITSGATTTFQHTGLNADTFYPYTLVATNGAAQSQAAQTNGRTFPNAPTVVSNTPSCGTGSVRLVLNGSGSVFNIYLDEIGGTAIAQTNEANYSTPIISQTTIYYISVIGQQGRESERTRVEAVVNPPIEATITEGSLVRSCDANTVLTANQIENATYYWLVNGVVIENSNSNTFTVNASGNYQVRIAKGGCLTTSNFSRVVLNYAPLAEITNGTVANFCENGTLSAKEATNATYSWTRNNTVVGTERELSVSQSGEYTLTVTEEGCSATDIIQVNVTSLPSISVSASSNSFCAGDKVILTADDINGVTYNWSRNGRVIRRNAPNTIEVTTGGEYSVSISQNGCSVSSSSTVNIERFNIETTYLRTTETTLFVEPATTSTQITSVVWVLDGTENSGLSGESITPTESGNYSAIVTYSTGCSFHTRTVYFRIPDPIVTGEDEELAKAFRIYPNPSNGTFKIELGEVKDEVTITVVDALGRVIKTDVIPAFSGSYSLNLARFAAGAYTIQLKTEKGIIIKKLMKE